MTQDKDDQRPHARTLHRPGHGQRPGRHVRRLLRLVGGYGGHAHRRRRRQRDRHRRRSDVHLVAAAYQRRREEDRRAGQAARPGHGRPAALRRAGTVARGRQRGPRRDDRRGRSRPRPSRSRPRSRPARGAGTCPGARSPLVSLAVMVVGMAGITAIEAVTGKPISSLLGKDAGTGTTVGHVVGDGRLRRPSRTAPRSSRTRLRRRSRSRPRNRRPSPPRSPRCPTPRRCRTRRPTPNDTPAPPVESQVPDARHGAVARAATRSDHWARNFWTSGNGFRPVPVAVLRSDETKRFRFIT